MAQPQKVDVKQPTRSRIAEKVVQIPPSGIRAFFELVIGRDDVLSLGVGEPDFPTPWRICEGAQYHVIRGETSYTSNSGLLSLRKKIARYLADRFLVQADPEGEILITVGASEGMDLALRALLNPGEEAIVWEPCYVAYAPLVRLTGATPVILEARGEDGFQLDLARLKSLITPKTRAILLNYPNNPTGMTLQRPTLEALLRVAVENEIVIVSDEIYAEMTHDGDHFSIASIPEAAEWVLLLSGFSKAFSMTGWRIGFAAGPSDIISAMTKIHQYSMLCAPIMGQRAAEIALREGMEDMRRMCEVFRQRRNYIVKGLNEIGLPCHKPGGAFYAFPSIKHTGLDSVEFCRRLLEDEQIAIVPGNAFGAAGEGYVRLAYAVGFDTIDRALEGIGRFLKKLGAA